MSKLTKISATALVALFLAACDKPSENASVSKQEKTTEAQVTSTEAETTEAQVTSTEAKTDEAMADFQKIIAWNAEQETALSSSRAELQQKFASQDPAQIQEGLSEFTKKINGVLKSLEDIHVSDEQVKTFKEKTKSVLESSIDLIAEQVKSVTSPDDKAIQESLQKKTQDLIESGNELQKLQSDLQQRFMAK